MINIFKVIAVYLILIRRQIRLFLMHARIKTILSCSPLLENRTWNNCSIKLSTSIITTSNILCPIVQWKISSRKFLHRAQEIRNTTFDRFITHLSTRIFTIESATPRKVMHIPSILGCQRLNTINIGYEVIETANYWMWNVSEHECYWLPRETEPERIWSSDIVRWWKCRSWSNFPLFQRSFHISLCFDHNDQYSILFYPF